MPRRLLLHLIPLLLGGCGLLGAAPTPRPVVRLLMENASPPFSSLNSSRIPEGFVPDLASAVAADQGFDLEFDLRPWQQVYTDFLAGQGDILGVVAFSEDRAKVMDFSPAYVSMLGGAYTAPAHPPINHVSDLRGKRLAVIRNSIMHEYAAQQDWAAVLVPCDNLEQCVRAIDQGTADVVLGMQLITEHTLRSMNSRSIVRSPMSFPDISYRLCFAVQPGRKDLLRQINQGLLNVHRSGEYDRLYEKWLGQLEPKRLRWRELQPYLLPAIALLVLGLLALIWQRRMLSLAKRQAEALHTSQERLSLVIEGSTDGFWDWDVPSGRVTRSARWAEMIGRRPDEIGDSREWLMNLIHPDDRPLVIADEQAVFDGKRDHYAIEFRVKSAGGEWKWILDRGKVVRRDPATSRPVRLAGTHTDITARKLAELENEHLTGKMLEAQKLESLGVLAGGIAHDFNNLLTVILGNASIIRLDVSPGTGTAGRLEKILTASQRAADLCRQLLAYAGKGSITTERIILNEMVRETAQLLEISIHRRAQLDYSFAVDLPAFEGDPSQIRQVVMNLVLNAAEAITGAGGRITVSTRREVLAAGQLAGALPASPAPGTYVVLEVSDTGSGMTPEVASRIFDPFFTTKFAGRGLGLAAVIGIVRAHEGALVVRSTPGLGSVFTLYFPAVSSSAAPGDAPVATLPSPLASGTVLVADDEGYVRELAAEILSRAGYTPVLAVDGIEAVELFKATPTRFCAVVLDITMPRLDGADALHEIRQIRTDVPCVFSSGHSAEDIRARFKAVDAIAFAQKPFTPERLLESLRAAITPTSGPR